MEREELIQLRRRRGLSQQALAGILRVHPMTLSRWERGVIAIPEPMAELIRTKTDPALGPVTNATVVEARMRALRSDAELGHRLAMDVMLAERRSELSGRSQPDLRRALKAALRLTNANPGSAEAWFDYAVTLGRLAGTNERHTVKALQAYREYERLSPQRAEFFAAMARLEIRFIEAWKRLRAEERRSRGKATS